MENRREGWRAFLSPFLGMSHFGMNWIQVRLWRVETQLKIQMHFNLVTTSIPGSCQHISAIPFILFVLKIFLSLTLCNFVQDTKWFVLYRYVWLCACVCLEQSLQMCVNLYVGCFVFFKFYWMCAFKKTHNVGVHLQSVTEKPELALYGFHQVAVARHLHNTKQQWIYSVMLSADAQFASSSS